MGLGCADDLTSYCHYLLVSRHDVCRFYLRWRSLRVVQDKRLVTRFTAARHRCLSQGPLGFSKGLGLDCGEVVSSP
ncbi:hypothetical protein FRX31_004857 [Thalictrum thalictroides]|uniref:Uncharacterized protein n=1 Tax=Thalictrum thalictroides TaxID=46969 RepID=A0A7J6X711_THATH|nr:hypothetical protein FRX31_004857 [Thalictrum thalictroides]